MARCQRCSPLPATCCRAVLLRRADMVMEMLEDDTNLLRSFEGLIMLEGTASNAKQAWNRWVLRAAGLVCGAAAWAYCKHVAWC